MTRLLVAGLGLIGARHAQMIAEADTCELVGVIDPDASLNKFGAPCFPSLEAVDVEADGVVLATPTPMHVAHAEIAASRGWHMLIEKPVADTPDGVARITAAAEAAGVRTLVGHHRRHHKSLQKLREIVSNDIGQPVLASCLWSVRKPDAYFEGNWRDGAAGSPVMINMVHDIDVLRFVMGDVCDVGAMGAAPLRNAGRAESGVISLRFTSGALGTIAFADCAPSPWGFEAGTRENPNIAGTGEDFLFISGSEGAVSFPSLTVWGGSVDWGKSVVAQAREVEDTVPLRAQLDQFVAVIGGAEPVITAADAGETLRVALQVQAAIDAQGVAA